MVQNHSTSHCFFFIFSFRKIEAKITVKIGDRYCIVTALARGMFCIVKKNINRAVVPKIPLKSKIFLLFPRIGMLSLYKKATLINKEIIERKRISSVGGICGKYLTQICIQANARVEPSI
jgi:hypothetical protein